MIIPDTKDTIDGFVVRYEKAHHFIGQPINEATLAQAKAARHQIVLACLFKGDIGADDAKDLSEFDALIDQIKGVVGVSPEEPHILRKAKN